VAIAQLDVFAGGILGATAVRFPSPFAMIMLANGMIRRV
jgi:hypothetical protein